MCLVLIKFPKFYATPCPLTLIMKTSSADHSAMEYLWFRISKTYFNDSLSFAGVKCLIPSVITRFAQKSTFGVKLTAKWSTSASYWASYRMIFDHQPVWESYQHSGTKVWARVSICNRPNTVWWSTRDEKEFCFFPGKKHQCDNAGNYTFKE